MIEFRQYTPVKIFFGADCVTKNAGVFSETGKRAFIMTGKHSGKESGALADVLKVLDSAGIAHYVFDSVKTNPGLENVKRAGDEAADFGADFIVGIGGGSSLDAAKAAAVLAVNRMEPILLYENIFPVRPLPIIAIPTTAGTGSEVTRYSVLTRDDLETKMSFGNETTFPAAAFLDPAYTESLPMEITADTAVDAMSHALEGYLSKRSDKVSDMLAMESLRTFAKVRTALASGKIDYTDRENLLYASMIAGIVIARVGTTVLHAMGYSLTYFKGVAHGQANGILMEEYLKYNLDFASEKIKAALGAAGFESVEDLGDFMRKIFGTRISATQAEIADFAKLTLIQKNVKATPREPGAEEIADIIRKSLDRSGE